MTDTNIPCNIVLSELSRKKLKEYLSRIEQTETDFVSSLIESFLDRKIDTSFDGWYAYLVKEGGMEPGDKAEHEAYLNSIGNQFVPEVKVARSQSRNTDFPPMPF